MFRAGLAVRENREFVFMKWFVMGGAFLLAVFLEICRELHGFRMTHYTISSVKWPKDAGEDKVLFLSDLHNHMYGERNEKLLKAIARERPAAILIGGDMPVAKVETSFAEAADFVEGLCKICPVYYVNGNHEQRLRISPRFYGKMEKRYRKALKRIGLEPMVNSHVNLPEFGIAVYGAEIDMEYYKRFHIRKMPPEYMPRILGQASGDAYTVLLAHNPDYFPQYAAWGADLTLSGHVHGGVARVPVWGKGVLAPSWHVFPKYDGGIFREGSAVMVLSRGLGSHTIPVRVFNPGELWVLDFQPEETDVLS